MKTVVHPLLIAVLVLPVLSTSTAFAGGPGAPRPPFTMHRLAPSQEPYLERESHVISPADGDRDQIDNDRMYWHDLDRDPVDPVGSVGHPPNGGGASAPLDGGISLLLAAGIGLGLKRAMGKKKASDKDGTSDEEGTIIL